jgi:hypothetical protein
VYTSSTQVITIPKNSVFHAKNKLQMKHNLEEKERLKNGEPSDEKAPILLN